MEYDQSFRLAKVFQADVHKLGIEHHHLRCRLRARKTTKIEFPGLYTEGTVECDATQILNIIYVMLGECFEIEEIN